MQNSFENIPAQLRGLLLFVGVLALIVAAYFLTEDADSSLQIVLIACIIGGGLVMAYAGVSSNNEVADEIASSSSEQPVRAAVPLAPLPPYQLKQPEPTITIQIPARTEVALVLVLVIFSMVYLRIARQDRDQDDGLN